MLRNQRAALLLGGAMWLLAPRAAAAGWKEVRETGGDVRLEVRADGVATVQHRVRYRVVAGRFESLDFVGVDPRSVPAPEAVITRPGVDGEMLARVETVAKEPGTLRLLFDEPRGLGRGVYYVDLRYELDLVAANMLTRDGAMWKVAWTAPPARGGQDGARVVFDLPAAPTEPRLADASEATTTLASLRRSQDRDELELVRAHVPRGEAATWSVQVDPRAFPGVSSPALSPPPTEPPDSERALSNAGRLALPGAFLVIAGVLAALLRRKQRTVREAASQRGVRARPLLPLPWGLAPFAYGVLTVGGLALMLWNHPGLGAALVAAAMAVAVHRAPTAVARPRPPGIWRPLSGSSALVAPSVPGDALDVTTTRGQIVLFASACGVVAVAWTLGPWQPQITIALPLAAASLVPLFVTGTRAQLPPTPIELAASTLKPARDALAAAIDLSHVEVETIGRVVTDGSGSVLGGSASEGDVDEIRLTCAPRDPAMGLRAIELAVASSPLGCAAPEVFVRFDDGSPAGERVARIAEGAPAVLGRTPEEKVVRLAPVEPSATAAATLVAEMLLALEGRRAADRDDFAPTRWEGKERRRKRARRGAGAPHAVPVC